MYVTGPKLIVLDTQLLEPPLHGSRLFEPELMRLQLVPEGVQSSRYARTTPSLSVRKSSMALQKLSEAEPSSSTPVTDATQSWYLVGSVSLRPWSDWLSSKPGNASRPGS